MIWELPDTSIFSKSESNIEDPEKFAHIGDRIVERFNSLGVILNVEKIDIGPQTIRFNMIAAEGTPVRFLSKYRDETAYEIGSKSVRILAPIPGERLIGVEIEHPEPSPVLLRDVVEFSESPLTVPLGIQQDGLVINSDVRKMPHLLCAGQTGSGKSTFINSMLCSLLSKSTPDDLNLMLVDTKMVEMMPYEDIPHLLCPVLTDAYDSINHFEALVSVMENRYEMAQEVGARNLDELNERVDEKIPYILVVVDEMADLMLISKRAVEESIVRIAQKARAVGIHLVLATQTPRREIVTGILKANLPSRLAFSTASALDSRIILDRKGSEELLGRGDALFSDQGKSPIRIQSPLVDSNEISSLVNHWSYQNKGILV